MHADHSELADIAVLEFGTWSLWLGFGPCARFFWFLDFPCGFTTDFFIGMW